MVHRATNYRGAISATNIMTSKSALVYERDLFTASRDREKRQWPATLFVIHRTYWMDLADDAAAAATQSRLGLTL
jgi:hypothetical protein